MAWLSGFSNRLKLTIPPNNVDSTLTDFPVMINLSTDSGLDSYDASAVFDELSDADYKRIAVTVGDGTTQCPVEIEYWDSIGEKAILWSKIPNVYSTVDTHMYLYFDATYSGTTASGNVDYIGDINDTTYQMVVDYNQEGTYDDDRVMYPSVIKESDTSYKMWYAGRDTLFDFRIMYATSTDGIAWTGHQMVIDIGDEGTYDTANVRSPYVIKESDTSYKIWYAGQAGSTYRMLYATSTNGTSWSNHQMVVNIGDEGTYDTTNVYQPSVIKESASSYKMWYAGHDGTNYRIIYAISDNGTTWSGHSMVINKGAEGTYDTINSYYPHVLKESDTSYKMWYTGYDGSTLRIIYADSSNGTTWGNFEMVLDIDGEGTYDTVHIFSAFILDDDLNTMWYSGVDGAAVYRIMRSTYWKNPAQDVWDDNFVGIWHMGQNPAGDVGPIKDSTFNTNNGTISGSMDSNDLVDGKIGKAIDFDGIDDYIDVGDVSILDGAVACTFEIILNRTSFTADGAFIRKWRAGQQSFVFGQAVSLSDQLRMAINDTGGVNVLTGETTDANIANSTTVYAVGVWSGSNTLTIYENAVSRNISYNPQNTPISIADSTEHLSLSGRYNAGLSDLFTNGVLDEIRISNTARSAAWIKATYHSNWDDFIVFQDELPAEWLSDWAKRIELTVDSDKIDTTLYDFPACLTLTSGTNAADIFTELFTVSGTKKIALTTYDGTTQCPVEIQQWDWAAEEVILWTKVPVVASAEDTTLYLYYDNTKSDNTSYVGDTGDLVARDVWDDSFVGVYHMSQDPMGGASSIINSAGVGNYGTPAGFSNWRSNGSIFTDEFSTTTSGSWSTSHDASGENNWVTFEGAECVELVCYTAPDTARMYKYDIATDGEDRIVVTFRAYFDEIQNISNGSMQMNLRRSDVGCYIRFGDDGVGVWDGGVYNTIGGSSAWFSEGEWYTWTLDMDFSIPASATVDIYLDGVLKSSGADCSYTGSFPNTHIAFMQYSVTTARTYVDYVHIGTQFGVGSNLIDGKVGKAIDFDGTDDYIDIGTHSSLDLIEAFTYEAIFKTSVNVSQDIIAKHNESGADYQMELHINATDSVASNIYNSVLTGVNCNTVNGLGGDFIDNQWHYVATGIDVIYGDGYSRLYMDGVLNVTSSTSISDINSLSTIATQIGERYNATLDRDMSGILDEIRVSNINRSASWIKATYYSNWNTLITYGTPETMPVSPTHYYYGYITEDSSPAARTVRVYNRDTGALMSSTTSNVSTGYYYLTTTISGEHYIVTLDDEGGLDFNALVLDKLLPRGIE